MHEALSKFQEVERILRENEQLHRRLGCLEVENHRLADDLRPVTLKLEWIATIGGERPQRTRDRTCGL